MTNPGDYNSKYTGTYGDTNYTKGLKVTNSTSVNFTTGATCDLVVVQSIASNGGNLIKIDGTAFATNYNTISYYDDVTNKIRVYTVKNLTAGDHNITAASELGLLYVGVTEADTKVKTPVISPVDDSSFYEASQAVTITCATEGATIYYTLDGTTPTSLSTVYKEAFNISATTTVKAIAIKDGLDNSDVATATITKINSYTISYDKGANGTGTIAEGNKIEGEAFTLTSETFTREGYIQTGWATSDGGVKTYDLGGSYTTDEDITLYPVWMLGYTYVVALSSDTGIEGMTGWTFSTGDHSATSTSVDYEKEFGATFPGSGEVVNNDYIAFAKNSGVYAMFDIGYATTVSAVTGTFYVGSSNARTFTIDYLGADGSTVKHTITVNHPAGSNWGADEVNETVVVPNVRYIKIKGMASNQSWIVMSAFSVSYGVETMSITPAYNKTTYVTTNKLNFTGVEGLKAYVATEASAGKVTLSEVAAVPENTPLLLIGTAGTTYNVPVASSATAPAENLLVKGDGTTVFNGSTYDYILFSDGKFYQIGSGTVATNKAYLHCDTDPTAAGARSLDIIFDDETTGITDNNRETITNNREYFNLAGQRVAQPTKGLYIVNGRKVVIR